MIKKLYKLPDTIIFKSIFLITILWSLKYFFLPLQVPFTLITQNFIYKNTFYSNVAKIKKTTTQIADFHDYENIGFFSDTNQSSVFDIQNSIQNFYITQYGIVPSILKNDIDQTYVVAFFDKKVFIPEKFTIMKQINKKLYILKRIKND